MKYVISLFLTTSALASPIHVFYETDSQYAVSVKEILVKNYGIPEDLISLKNTSACEEVKKIGKLDLCLKNNGDLLVVSVDREFINESLKIFQAP